MDHELRIGCSGFNYSDWKGTFYPRGLAQSKWLGHYSTVFDTVELNVTFYGLPLSKSFERWRDETPDGFAFSLKGSRFITHIKRLLDVEEPVRTFFDRAMILDEKIKVVLWQFPAAFKYDIARLNIFLHLLSHYPVRHTLEFRNESWINDETVALCKGLNISLCTADSPPFLNDVPQTSDFVYIRRHGVSGNYSSDYPKSDLRKDASEIKSYLKTKDVFIYFNNDAYGYAPKNARELAEMLK